MVKEFMKLLGGEISVDSKPGQGSRFTLYFPIQKSVFVNKEDAKHISDTMHVDVLQSDTSGKHTILVVEDHEGLKNYLVELLAKQYKVVSVNNGEEARLLLRKNKTFDLILSDWMMSEMDGISLCKYVRKKSSLSTIPFILLTALGQIENLKEGYGAGADEYISKPFKPELLFLKIEKLLRQNKQIEQAVKVGSMVQPTRKNETSFDEKLVKRITGILDEQLSNTEFNQQMLANELGVSQMQLYRKVKEYMQTTPSDLIRSMRLKKAKLLLENKSFTVNEVSYKVGFNDPKYFSRCFTIENGISPSAFRKDKVDN
jgi:DNA-binding response OmpR family regulator